MFEDLSNYDFRDITVILIDDMGELVFKINCQNDYEFMMVVNHTTNMLLHLKKNIIFAEIKFENFYMKIFSLGDYKLFFIKEKIFSFEDKKMIYEITEKIKNILEG